MDVSTFSVLLLLFMFTFALLGMELFANKVRFSPDDRLDYLNGVAPNNNYDTVLNAFTTVFVVMTADAWSSVYFLHYRAFSNIATTIYFLLLIIIG